MRRHNARAQEEQSIDLTPMLDVVFIMLIFFIVTASFIKETGVEVDRPDAVTAEAKPNAAILIAVNSNSEIWVDKRRIDVRAVRSNVERLRAENPEGAVVIQADEKALAEVIIEVMDAVRDAGVFDVSLATEE